ncbi:MAG TPA: asparagine synthase-related protein [Solirubrobacteraceae bacterium]|nr:asparagine synthase-related protein [Solirubrobacteraceae bacterium]
MSVVIAAAGRSGALDAVTRAWLTDATGYASFAGPDGSRTESGEGWALGHCLLRTGHGESSIGPVSLDGRVWLSADVRLDDRGSLIAALRSRGVSTDAAADDAELVLGAYAAWGEQLVDHLAGDFAFALWDTDRRTLICARDQFGIVPLHYAVVGDQVLVASSVELLLLHSGVDAALDEIAIADWLLMGHATEFESTAFAAIRRVAPAHVLRVSPGDLRVRRYWRAPEYLPLLRFRRPDEYVEHFRGLFERAVADRIAPGALSSQLSGGMDSTAITAMAHRLRVTGGADGELRAVTAVLGGASGDLEGDWASLVAQALEIPHDLIDDSQRRPVDPFAVPKLLTPEPTPYQWTDWQYELARTAAHHGRTCLAGLGADFLLGFAPWYWVQWLAAGQIRRLAAAVGDEARLFGERPHPHVRFLARYLLGQWRAPADTPPDWLDTGLAASVDAAGRLRDRSRAAAWTADKRSLTRDPIWQTWFTWADPTVTRLPLRVRQPFMDLRLLDFAARIPPHPWLVRKRILREATADLLPSAIRERRKTLLVAAPRAGTSAEDRGRLVELVRAVPDAERFLDTSALTATILRRGDSDPHDGVLDRPIGLVLWLAHWKRPRGARG